VIAGDIAAVELEIVGVAPADGENISGQLDGASSLTVSENESGFGHLLFVEMSVWTGTWPPSQRNSASRELNQPE
jgi:hypothetical protein